MLLEVSRQLDIPLNQVYHVATFYKAFSLVPRGRHLIRVCMGTSCKVRGSTIILDRVKGVLGIEEGEVSPDGRFTLTTVNCLGCCAIGPMLTIDGDYYEHVKVADVKRILSKYE
jgi:NADH-quinone oxidoreductase subunit E